MGRHWALERREHHGPGWGEISIDFGVDEVGLKITPLNPPSLSSKPAQSWMAGKRVRRSDSPPLKVSINSLRTLL